MAKGQHLTSYQRGIVNRYYDNQDTIVLGKLGEIASDLYVCTDEKKAAGLWKSAQLALKKTSIDPLRSARIVNERRVEELARVVQELSQPGAKVLASGPKPAASSAPAPGVGVRGPGGAGSTPPASPTAAHAGAHGVTHGGAHGAPRVEPSASAAPTPEQVKGALTAFKKRLKVSRLDEESRISNRALTAGRKSAIAAIQPPNEYPKACWDELVKQGKIKPAGGGLYSLVE